MLKFLLCVLNLICVISPSQGRQCVGKGPCSCEFDDGSGVVDITSLGNSDGARFQDQTSIIDVFLYNYNPCAAFTLGSCSNVAVCQTDASKTEFYTLGTQDTADWSFDGTNLQIYYSSNSDVFRETFVTAICDESAEDPTISVTGESSPHQYYFEIKSQCACPGLCTESGTTSGGPSGGTVLLIILIVLVVVYVAGGMTYNRVKNQKTGVEMLPNREFWGSIPGHIKGGFVYLFSCVGGKKTTYDQV